MKEYAVITGASAGIGLEFARQFARRGTSTVLVARSADKLESVAEELRVNFNVDAIALPLDISENNGRRNLIEYVEKNGIDARWLVNSAGYGSEGFFTELELANETKMTELNCVAVQDLSYHFAKSFIRKKRGTVINVASMASFQPVPYMATYGATKAFVLNFSMALRRELAGTGVNVFALCPGPVDTDFFRNAGMKKPHGILKVLPAEFVVLRAFKGIEAGKAFMVTGTINKILYYVGSFAPLTLRAWTAGKMFGPGPRHGNKH